MSEPERRPWQTVNVVITASLAVATIGLISGIEGTRGDGRGRETNRPYDPRPTEARSYRDMRERDYGPNRDLSAAWFASIRRPDDVHAPVVQSAADRATALDRRAGRRAYDGAPPTVPHPVDQQGAPACLACHERGARIGALVAPAMSHARRDSCLQCHVVAADPRTARETPAAPETAFAGTRPAPGERAWNGAPPTIPHATWMREQCDSCHGTRGALGMRTTHPWRASCTQCHAPSATLDQRAPGLPGGAP